MTLADALATLCLAHGSLTIRREGPHAHAVRAGGRDHYGRTPHAAVAAAYRRHRADARGPAQWTPDDDRRLCEGAERVMGGVGPLRAF